MRVRIRELGKYETKRSIVKFPEGEDEDERIRKQPYCTEARRGRKCDCEEMRKAL